MSARSLFWVEAAAIAKLLGKIGGSPAGHSAPAFWASPESPPASQLDAPGAALRVPESPFEARLEALCGWLLGAAICDEAFVIDGDGLALIEEKTPAELLAAAAALGRRLDSLQRTGELTADTSIVIELPDSRRLHLLGTDTRWGLLQLGFITRRLLPRGTLEAVGEAFRRTVDEKERDRS